MLLHLDHARLAERTQVTVGDLSPDACKRAVATRAARLAHKAGARQGGG